jgi:hypothetical protein
VTKVLLGAVIDSGIDAAHPDLEGSVTQRYDAVGTQAKPHPHAAHPGWPKMGAATKIDVNPVPTSADERATQLPRYTFLRGGNACQREGPSMISLAILSFLAGAALGLWFRVPVLVLAIMLALIAVVGAGAATEVNPWWIALEALVVTVCLQLGYISGIVIATYVPAREYRTRQLVISDFWPP